MSEELRWSNNNIMHNNNCPIQIQPAYVTILLFYSNMDMKQQQYLSITQHVSGESGTTEYKLGLQLGV